MKLQTIETPNAPTPLGHYSQAIVCNGIIYIAGQLAVEPHTNQKKLGSIEEQTEQVLKNISEILKAAGSDLDHLLKITVYIADISLWGTVNEVYGRILGAHRPARSVVPTGNLHHGFLIGMDAIAATRG